MKLFTKGTLLTVFLATTVCARASNRCAAFFREGSSVEMKASIVVGRAMIYRGHPEYGAEKATRCLFGVFDQYGGNYDILPVDFVSDALLAIMIVNPSEWLHAATSVDPKLLEAWLKKPILSSQGQPMGRCPKPDRFELASHSLGGLVLSDVRQERVRKEVENALASLQCEELN